VRLIDGLPANTSFCVKSLIDAGNGTEKALETKKRLGSIGPTRYVCLSDSEALSIPKYRLDDLLKGEALERRQILVKCDVEGAEMLVLSGARSFLQKSRPALLLSVHPSVLPDYGHTKEQISTFLANLGYDVSVISVDHEEHWWCKCK